MDKPIRKPNDEKGMLGNGKEKRFCSSHTAELICDLPLLPLKDCFEGHSVQALSSPARGKELQTFHFSVSTLIKLKRAPS